MAGKSLYKVKGSRYYTTCHVEVQKSVCENK